MSFIARHALLTGKIGFILDLATGFRLQSAFSPRHLQMSSKYSRSMNVNRAMTEFICNIGMVCLNGVRGSAFSQLLCSIASHYPYLRVSYDCC